MCRPWHTCTAGRHVSRPASVTADRQCNLRSTGGAAAPGTAESTQLTCNPYTTRASDDLVFEALPLSGGITCRPLQTCAAGSRVAAEGSYTADRHCCQCDPSTEFSDDESLPNCAELGCTTSTDSSIVSVISSFRVSVTGAETGGLDVSYGSYNPTLPMRVLFKFPHTVTVSADAAGLSSIAGWFDEVIAPDRGTFKCQAGQMRPVIEYGVDSEEEAGSGTGEDVDVEVVVVGAASDVTSAPTGRWSSDGTSSLVETNLTMAVSPPPAEDLVVLPATTVLVPSGGAAAAAGCGSSQALSVALAFRGRRRTSNLQAGSRVSYSIALGTAEDGAISIGDSGVITAGPVASNLASAVASQIEFEGQTVSASVAITITSYLDIEVDALPFPSFAGSTNVGLTQTSLIEDVSPPQWQQAQLQLRLRMTLMDGRNALLSNVHVVLAAEASDESVDASTSSGTTRVLTATAGGNAAIDISGSFSGATTTSNLTIDESEVAARVVSVVSVRPIGAQSPTSNPTLTGAVGIAARRTLGVTLSESRSINNAVANSGTTNLPGLFRFRFTPAHAGVLAVVAASGRMTLNTKYHDQITLTGQVGQRQRVLGGAKLPTSCNLIANDAGGADLGRTVGWPTASLAVGSAGRIEMRVHTGGQTLGSFHATVFYNATALNMAGAAHRARSPLGSLDQRTGIPESRAINEPEPTAHTLEPDTEPSASTAACGFAAGLAFDGSICTVFRVHLAEHEPRTCTPWSWSRGFVGVILIACACCVLRGMHRAAHSPRRAITHSEAKSSSQRQRGVGHSAGSVGVATARPCAPMFAAASTPATMSIQIRITAALLFAALALLGLSPTAAAQCTGYTDAADSSYSCRRSNLVAMPARSSFRAGTTRMWGATCIGYHPTHLYQYTFPRGVWSSFSGAP